MKWIGLLVLLFGFGVAGAAIAADGLDVEVEPRSAVVGTLEDAVKQHWTSYRRSGPFSWLERHSESDVVWGERAEDHVDAFCTEWNDGCVACRRIDWNGEKSCRLLQEDPNTCRRGKMRCTTRSRNQARICLYYFDMCNEFNNGTGDQTLDGCPKAPRFFSCVTRRKATVAEYGDDFEVAMDLAGRWWLVGPDERECTLVLWATGGSLGTVRVEPPCAPDVARRLAFDDGTRPRRSEDAAYFVVNGERLKIVVSPVSPGKDAKATFSFSLIDLDRPVGLGASKGWRLLRIAAPDLSMP